MATTNWRSWGYDHESVVLHGDTEKVEKSLPMIHLAFSNLKAWLLGTHGQVDRSPTFKNLDKGYDFMPRHAKQIGARQAVVPCQYRGFTCFAKIEF